MIELIGPWLKISFYSWNYIVDKSHSDSECRLRYNDGRSDLLPFFGVLLMSFKFSALHSILLERVAACLCPNN